jgi:hypothetical protein
MTFPTVIETPLRSCRAPRTRSSRTSSLVAVAVAACRTNRVHNPGANPMTDHAELLMTARELDSRVSDGIRVHLLWNEPDDRLLISAVDHRTSHAFRLPVRRGQRALDVFQDPYAYAGWRMPSTLSAMHLFYLIEFQSRAGVLTRRAFNYVTRCRGSRLISRRPA